MTRHRVVNENAHYRLVYDADDGGFLQDYGIRRSAWLRGVRLAKHFGTSEALELVDARAERALARGDLDLCIRWRDLIVAIHAIANDEPLLSDRVH